MLPSGSHDDTHTDTDDSDITCSDVEGCSDLENDDQSTKSMSSSVASSSSDSGDDDEHDDTQRNR